MNGDQVAGRAGNGIGPADGGDGAGSGGAKPAARAAAKSAPASAPVGKGLNTLLAAGETRGAAGAQAKACGYKAAGEGDAKVLLPAWFFFSADILLLAFCVAVCFDAPKPLDLGHVLFCAASVGLGALLSIVGVLKSE